MTSIPSPALRHERETRLAGSLADGAVYLFLLLLGTFQITHYSHFPDFVGDVTYPDLARSLLENGSYQIRLLAETTLPPGLPLILALVGKFTGLSPGVEFAAIAVFTTLGLISGYILLRRVEGRGVAILASLLLASYFPLFGFNIAVVFPEMPYFFFSMVVLLLALRIDRVDDKPLPIVWISVLAAAVVSAVLIRSVGVALLAAFISWIAVTFIRSPKAGQRRATRFVIPLAFGLAAQLAWSVWAQRHQLLEWQLPGYPGSYTSQLAVKDGQHPELGLARWSDIPVRIERNIVTRTGGLANILVRRHVSEFWSSPAVFGVFFCIVVGWLSSVRKGGQLHDWYYLWYECIFWVWPWDYRDRFVYPVVPLACLYIWRGLKAIRSHLLRHPRRGGLVLALIAGALFLCSAAFALRKISFPIDPDHLRGDHLQMIAAALFWGVLAVAGVTALIFPHDKWSDFTRAIRPALPAFQFSSWVALWLGVGFLTVTGIKTIIGIGHNRLHPDLTQESLYPELDASNWIRTHEPANLTVMAREPEFIFHYTHDPAVWFPPISDPVALMAGVKRLHADLILVAHHPNSYWLPSEEACFQALQQAYPSTFRLLYRGTLSSVYAVAPHGNSGRSF
jgi:hypothetical protein